VYSKNPKSKSLTMMEIYIYSIFLKKQKPKSGK